VIKNNFKYEKSDKNHDKIISLHYTLFMKTILKFVLKIILLLSSCFVFSFTWFLFMYHILGILSMFDSSIGVNVMDMHSTASPEFIFVLPFFGGIALCIIVLPIYLIYTIIRNRRIKKA
jgi:glucan phosphoethanolaminetransferase (alkaline phosphatase superfamily)